MEPVQADGEEVLKALKEEVDDLMGTLCDSFARADGADDGAGPSGGADGDASRGALTMRLVIPRRSRLLEPPSCICIIILL